MAGTSYLKRFLNPMLSRRSLFIFLFSLITLVLLAEMTPNAPIKDFSLPRFGDEGYTEWVLKGKKGIYDGPEQVRVEGMNLRIYSGDERMALEMGLESPSATIRIEENIANSEDLIQIEGNNFSITGIGWEWIGETREIVVHSNTRVEFAQSIGQVDSSDSNEAGAHRTVILSDRLILQSTAEEYHFEFNGEVKVTSGDWTLESNLLEVLAEPPTGEKRKKEAKVATGEIDSVRRVIAREDVVFTQEGRTVTAGEALIVPQEEKTILSQSPTIQASGAYLSGEKVTIQGHSVEIEASASGERAQMILTETGGLGIQGAGALSSETIILSEKISLLKTETGHRFVFQGRVEAFSGEMQITSEFMEVIASDGALGEKSSSDRTSPVRIGRVDYLRATEQVEIDRGGQVAMAEEVWFYPEESRAVLNGAPEIRSETAVVSGSTMELRPKLAIVRGTVEKALSVVLPPIQDLGYQLGPGDQSSTSEEASPAEPIAESPTRIESQLLNMISDDLKTVFRFTDDAHVTATNLTARCERLDAITFNEESGARSEQNESLSLSRIEAHDGVEIEQGDRIATSNRAIILPDEGKLILEEDAKVTDPRGVVEGHRLTILEGQQRVILEGDREAGERARITLPGLIDREF